MSTKFHQRHSSTRLVTKWSCRNNRTHRCQKATKHTTLQKSVKREKGPFANFLFFIQNIRDKTNFYLYISVWSFIEFIFGVLYQQWQRRFWGPLSYKGIPSCTLEIESMFISVKHVLTAKCTSSGKLHRHFKCQFHSQHSKLESFSVCCRFQ